MARYLKVVQPKLTIGVLSPSVEALISNLTSSSGSRLDLGLHAALKRQFKRPPNWPLAVPPHKSKQSLTVAHYMAFVLHLSWYIIPLIVGREISLGLILDLLGLQIRRDNRMMYYMRSVYSVHRWHPIVKMSAQLSLSSNSPNQSQTHQSSKLNGKYS